MKHLTRQFFLHLCVTRYLYILFFNIFTWPALTETVDNLSHSFIGLREGEMTTSVYIIPDTMVQLWTPSLVSRTSQ